MWLGFGPFRPVQNHRFRVFLLIVLASGRIGHLSFEISYFCADQVLVQLDYWVFDDDQGQPERCLPVVEGARGESGEITYSSIGTELTCCFSSKHHMG